MTTHAQQAPVEEYTFSEDIRKAASALANMGHPDDAKKEEVKEWAEELATYFGTEAEGNGVIVLKGTRAQIYESVIDHARAVHEQTREESIEFFRQRCIFDYPLKNEQRIAKLQEKIVEFADEVKQNAYYALRWADSQFVYASELQERVGLREWLKRNAESDEPKTQEEILEAFAEQLRKDVVRELRSNTFNSTSQCQNIQNDADQRARAEILKDLSWQYIGRDAQFPIADI